MPLPPYEPDGSLPPLPLEEVTAKDLIARYGVSKKTLYTRLGAIGVTGTKRGKQVFFDSEDVFRLDAAHHFLVKGYGLKDLKEACGSFSDQVVEVGSPSSQPIPAPPTQQQMELTIAPQQERVVIALTSAVKQALEATAPLPPRDPLRSYRLLQESALNKYQLTSRSLQEILEVSLSTIHGWGKEVSRNGFRLKRVGAGRWRVFVEDEEDG
jgi:DNA-binding transcriptional MerR regulator